MFPTSWVRPCFIWYWAIVHVFVAVRLYQLVARLKIILTSFDRNQEMLRRNSHKLCPIPNHKQLQNTATTFCAWNWVHKLMYRMIERDSHPVSVHVYWRNSNKSWFRSWLLGSRHDRILPCNHYQKAQSDVLTTDLYVWSTTWVTMRVSYKLRE